MKRIVVLVSGRGSNLKKLIDDSAEENCPYEIVLVISDKSNILALDLSREAGIPIKVIHYKEMKNRKHAEKVIHHFCDLFTADFIVCAGFMKVLGTSLIKKWENKILNIHPSLLPAFPGLKVHERVIEAGAKVSGCTVHFVTGELDGGPIISQRVVTVYDHDTPETLAVRVLEQEHILLPYVVRKMAEDKIVVDNGKVFVVE